MKIGVLYFDGCPNHEASLLRLSAILAAEGLDVEVQLRRIQSVEEAERERFLGSPTVRVDGEDVEPGAGEREGFGLECRLYLTAAGLERVPPAEWIRKSLRRAHSGSD